jgi:hypothetical protein
MSAETTQENAGPAPESAATKAKPRQSPIARLQYDIHALIDAPMARSLHRLSRPNTRVPQAYHLREALHLYLAHYDPQYRQAIGLNTANQHHG